MTPSPSEFKDLNENSQLNMNSVSMKKSILNGKNTNFPKDFDTFNFQDTNDGSSTSICETKLALVNQIGVIKDFPLSNNMHAHLNPQQNKNYWRNSPHVPDSEYYSHEN